MVKHLLFIVYFNHIYFHPYTDPNIVESPSNASILQGWNHTFWCKGNGSHLDWKINGIDISKLPDYSKLMVVELDHRYLPDNGCGKLKESSITVHVENDQEGSTLSTFTIQCVIRSDPVATVVSEVHLNVHGEFISSMSIRVHSTL